MKDALSTILTRKRLVSSFPPGIPIQAVFFDKEKNNYFRTNVIAINAFEIKSYNNHDEFDKNDPCGVDVEYSMVDEEFEFGYFDNPTNYKDFICFEFNNKKNSRKQLDLMKSRKTKK